MPGRQKLFRDEPTHVAWEAQEPHQIRNGRSVLPHPGRHLLLGVTELRDEPAVGRGLFNGIEILALDVLDEGDLEHLMIGHFPHQHGDFLEPGSLSRPPPPLPGNELKSRPVFTDDHGLDDALLAQGPGEIGELLFVDMLAAVGRGWGRSAPGRPRVGCRFRLLHPFGFVPALRVEGRRAPYRALFSSWRNISLVKVRYASAPLDRISYSRIGFPNEGASARRMFGTMASNTAPGNARRTSSMTCVVKFGARRPS